MATTLDHLLFGPDQACFGCGPNNAHGLRLRFEQEGDLVRTTFDPRDGQEGPPGILHGGLQATLLDEIAAWTVITLRQKMAFTSTLNVRLVRPVRMAARVTAVGRLTAEGNGMYTVAAHLEQEGKKAARAKVTLRALTEAGAARLLDRPVPTAWRPFCRDD